MLESFSENESDTCSSESHYSYFIVGDNFDKNIRPREMRVDNQMKSLHYFNSYAGLDRVCQLLKIALHYGLIILL